MNIKKSIFKVFSTNFLQVISSLIVGFIVPNILSIDGYASLKTFTLYVSYIGLLHFGYFDGLYIKYGGKKYEQLNFKELKGEHIFSVCLETIVMILIIFLGVINNNVVIILFGISILPINMSTFFKGIFQATGEFEKYTRIIKIYTIIYTISNIILALILKYDNYILYCVAIILSNFFALIFFEIRFLIKTKNVQAKFPKDFWKIMKIGSIMLLGNIIVVGLFGIDKWFVKLFLSTDDFAYYSFAVSMLNIINTLVNAISVTFYNYLFENNSKEKINMLKKYLISLGGFASLAYFPLAFIVTYFIKKYIPSLDIIAITFAVFPYMILINALYVNLYKVNKNEKHYFKVVLGVLLISIIYNTVALLIFKDTTSIAMATLLTLLTWVIYSTIDLKNVTSDKKMYIYLIGITIIFLICANVFNWLIGGIIYFITYIIYTWIINKEVLIDLKNEICRFFKQKVKKFPLNS